MSNKHKEAQMARRKAAQLTREQIDIFKDSVKPKPNWMPQKVWNWFIRNLFKVDMAIIVWGKSIEAAKQQDND